MDSLSKDTLLAVEQNSNKVTYLKVGAHHKLFNKESGCGLFRSEDSDDYNRLGTAVGTNTKLTQLWIDNISNNVTLNTTNKRFYNGIRRNSSITELFLNAITFDDKNIIDVALEVLKACQEKNIISKLLINTMPLMNSTDESRFIESLRGFTNLREITFVHSRITNDQLLPMVEAIRGHGLLERVNLMNNNIGDTGCEALATLRNLTYLNIADNDITNEGMIAFANSISENSCLRKLNIEDDYSANPFNLRAVADSFCTSLCNTSNINNIYSSNHTVETIVTEEDIGAKLKSLLELNKSTRNKRHVAIKKILLYYTPDFDMEPLFDLSLEEEDSERNLKALPHVISWFETAVHIADLKGDSLPNDGSISDEESEDEHTSSSDDSVPDEESEDEDDSFSSNDSVPPGEESIDSEEVESTDLERRKLFAIYQFAMAMPMLFVPASHDKRKS